MLPSSLTQANIDESCGCQATSLTQPFLELSKIPKRSPFSVQIYTRPSFRVDVESVEVIMNLGAQISYLHSH